ncbi:unnamed protein product, partial [Rotaria sp. Silwood1]
AKNRPRLDLEDPHITDDEVKMWTGWRRSELSVMQKSISGLMKDSKNRSTELALAMFWIKLRTNLTYDQIGMLMNYKSPVDDYRKRVAETCSSVQENLLAHFVPKSTYSSHKKRHLVKMLSIVLPDGYVVDAIGPFAGNANDASITESILQLNDSLQRWTDYGDILLVDRGFRDCIGSLEEAGFEVRMPAFLPTKQRQLPTADANASRLVTKNRVVEYIGVSIDDDKDLKSSLTSTNINPK